MYELFNLFFFSFLLLFNQDRFDFVQRFGFPLVATVDVHGRVWKDSASNTLIEKPTNTDDAHRGPS